MNSYRGYVKTTYSDGRVEIFDPFIRWMFNSMMGEIGIRHDYAVGYLWRYRIGTFSRFRTKWFEIGPLTLYVHLGMREAHNPRAARRP